MTQRRRSVAHYLTLIDADPAVVDDEGAYREALWSPPTPRSADHERVAGQWAGLVAKDVWQDALCSIWSEFCRAGRRRVTSRTAATASRGTEVRSIARGMVGGPPVARQPTCATVGPRRSASPPATSTLPGVDDAGDARRRSRCCAPRPTRSTPPPADSSSSWNCTAAPRPRRPRLGPVVDTSGPPGSRRWPTVLDALTTHLAEEPTVADTLWWIVHRFIVSVHERIAYSKLPEHTFRFRWEDGRVRFFDNGIGRFPLAAIRNEPLVAAHPRPRPVGPRHDDEAVLTARGRAFVAESLP